MLTTRHQALRAWTADLLRLASPSAPSPSGFAFLVHPREVSDILRIYPFLHGFSVQAIRRFFFRMWPLTLTQMSGLCSVQTGRPIPGWIIAVPMDAEQLLTNRATGRRRVRAAVRLARQRGAQRIGLGALLPALTGYGRRLQQADGPALTTGHALTTWSLHETLLHLFTVLQQPAEDATVAIVGAGGSVGTGLVHSLTQSPLRSLVLLDRPGMSGLLQTLYTTLARRAPHLRVRIGTDKSLLHEADIIVTATNAPTWVLRADDVPPGAIVLNDAQPSDVSPQLAQRPDVLTLEGGLVTVPGVHTNEVLGLPRANDVFGCLGETMVLAAHDWPGHYAVGRLDPELVAHIGGLAVTMGVKPAPLQDGQRLITNEDINRIRTIRKTHDRRHPDGTRRRSPRCVALSRS